MIPILNPWTELRDKPPSYPRIEQSQKFPALSSQQPDGVVAVGDTLIIDETGFGLESLIEYLWLFKLVIIGTGPQFPPIVALVLSRLGLFPESGEPFCSTLVFGLKPRLCFRLCWFLLFSRVNGHAIQGESFLDT